MNSDFFYWPGQPIITEIGPVSLPFGISVFALVIGIVIYFVATNYILQQQAEPSRKSKRRKKNEETEVSLPLTWNLGIFAASIIGTQLLFLLLGAETSTELGPLILRWYGILFAGAFLAGYFITRKLWINAGRNVEEVDSLLMYMLIATIVGARLGEVLFYEFEYYARNPIKVFYIWEGGLASHGATIGILIGLWLFVRKQASMSFLWLVDRVTLPVILGGAFIRLGNFFNSEIYGSVTDVPWAVVFQLLNDMLPRHPTMLYESIGCVLIFLLLFSLYKYYKNHPPEGLLTGTFFIALFSFRFFIEFTKDQEQFSPDFALGMGQILSIPFVAFGIWVLVSKVDWKQKHQE